MSQATLSLLCRSEVTIMCRGMVFWHYPLDQHLCTFRLSSCKWYRNYFNVLFHVHVQYETLRTILELYLNFRWL